MPASIQTQLEDRLVEIIRSMQLDWPRAEEVQARRLPWDVQSENVVIHRGITVFSLPPAYAPGTNLREDIGYGIGIAMLAATDHSTATNRGQVHKSREAIRRKIIHDRVSITLDGGDMCQIKTFEPEVNVPKEAHRYEYSLLGVRAWVRESRT